jgi:hypothetical protein
MIRLGLHLTVHSGRTALVRLAVTTASVGFGVALLLSVLAIFHGYSTTVGRACWTCTRTVETAEPQLLSTTPAAGAELWNHTQDFYQGRTIERLDVAALGPQAPVVPGLSRLPQAGEYAVSPALAALIATTPRAELGDRFPGAQIGLIGTAGLAGPDDLAIVIGRSVSDLAAVPYTIRVTAIQTTPQNRGDNVIYQLGIALGTVAILLPMLMLIGNATRLAAARREERYAAMRLVGATPRQVSVIASVDAVVGALLGSLLGIGLFVLWRPLVAGIRITGARFFPEYVTPTAAGYVAVLVGVPAAAAVAALLALRRVQVSPLGVSQRVTPPPPRVWRLAPLAAGLLLFIAPLATSNQDDPKVRLAALGLALTMAGLVIGGSWLTMQAARLLAWLRPGASSLLAARRMADDPRATFRSVSGLVLAVFVGTFLAAVVPAALAAQRPPAGSALDDMLRLQVAGKGSTDSTDSPEAQLTKLIAGLRSVGATAVLTIRETPPTGAGRDDGPPPVVLACADLDRFSALGRCAPGASTAMVDDGPLITDNVALLNRALPLVSPSSPTFTGDPSTLPVKLLLVTVDSHAGIERLRTFLTVNYPGLTGGSGAAPQTYAEVAQVRAELYTEVANVMLLVVGLTLLVAGCGLAIAMGGGIVDRRRPFSLLRVSGTPTAVLRRVVLLESVLPLLTATAVAVAAGLAVAMPVNRIVGRAGDTALHLPDHTYYLTMGTGLAVSLAIIVATLPLLDRVTTAENARFE